MSQKYDDLVATNSDLLAKNDLLQKDKAILRKEILSLVTEKEDLEKRVADLEQQLAASKKAYKNLKQNFDNLSSNSSAAINAKVKENQRLLTELDDRETKLLQDQAELDKLKQALEARSQQIQDLENLIASKEAAMQQLKDAISNALKGFEGKGLTVEQRNGKVYVSMENKLLFNAGSWNVGAQGKKAVVELAKVLVDNKTIEVLIEGHTDNDPYRGSTAVKDNWDLSVKRATAIVRILQANRVSPKQITAAGRGEFIPVATNDTKAGKAKNRRIEIILSPNLDEVTKLLN